jgi:hypothetical protein
VIEFRFEHDFQRAPSPAVIFEAYFDPALSDEQDRAVEVARREVLELDDSGGVLRRVCKVVPRRQLPAIVRPFVPQGLSYTETAVWRKAEDLIEMRIEPAVLGGRVEISATYRVSAAGPGVCRRVYAGHVSVQLALLGGRVERAIVDDLGRTLAKAAACTQAWLDARA